MGTQIAIWHWQYNMARFCFVFASMVMMVAVVVGRPQTAESPLSVFRPDLTLINLTDAELQEFLASREAVSEFTLCFVEGVRHCRSSPGAVRLIKQIGSLGSGGECKNAPSNNRREFPSFCSPLFGTS